MKKIFWSLSACLLVAVFAWCGLLMTDRASLDDGIIRLHIVANSDTEEDQCIKLKVRDAIVESLERDLAAIADVEKARNYLLENLQKLGDIANRVLLENGFPADAAVSIGKETFTARYYDTFALPAGVYEALRITIGDGAGQNWWCVAFPTLCLPTTTDTFVETAAGAGFSESLTGALSGEEEYGVRFYFLDLLGKLENYFFCL